MDEDDGADAWAHQMELEQRQQEEEAMERHRKLLAESRKGWAEFECEMNAINRRIEANWRELYGNHG
jgi:hypothetical protein